jgi:hypothetical protein
VKVDLLPFKLCSLFIHHPRASLRPDVESNSTRTVISLQAVISADWRHDVIISDESRFELYDDSRSVWIQRGVYAERTFHPMPKHNSSIMAWGQSDGITNRNSSLSLGHSTPKDTKKCRTIMELLMTCDVILVRVWSFPASWSSRRSSENDH